MLSRERVLTALSHRTPDRVPIDIGGTRQSGIAAAAYARLKELLDIASPTRIFDVYQMIAEIERPVIERFGGDCAGLWRSAVAFNIPNDGYRPWRWPGVGEFEVPLGFQPRTEDDGSLVLTNEKGDIIASMPEGGFYFDRHGKNPGALHVDPADLAPPPISSAELERLRQQANSYRQNSDFAIICQFGPPYELFYGLGQGDFSEWLMTLACEPEYVHQLYEILTQVWLENLRRLWETVGDQIDILQFNDDLGTQDAPFLSEKMFRELVMPYYQRGCDWIHAHTPYKIFMHSDGAIRPLLPALIEMGVDAINPVQTTAKGMAPEGLKADFGDQITFWGGACDCQQTLSFGSPGEVADDVERHVTALMPGGGYVCASVHNVQANVPPENIVALYDAARSAGAYETP